MGEPALLQVIARLERELEFFRREASELGAKVLRAQEEQSALARQLRHARTASRVVREAYMLADLGTPQAEIAPSLVASVVEQMMCDVAILYRAEEDSGFGNGVCTAFSMVCHVGIKPADADRLLLSDTREFVFTSGPEPFPDPPVELMSAAGRPYVLWYYDVRSGFALLLGNQQETNASRPFVDADKEIAEALVSALCDVLYRLQDLHRFPVVARSVLDTTGPPLPHPRGPFPGITEGEVHAALRAGGHIAGVVLVGRTAQGQTTYVGYLRGSWSPVFQIHRSFKDKRDRTYRNLERLVHLLRVEFGFDGPIQLLSSGSPELARFPGIRPADLGVVLSIAGASA